MSERIDTNLPYGKTGLNFFYRIFEDGYDIYIGDTEYPTYVQREPYIPIKSLSYEENAKEDCKQYSEASLVEPPKKITVEEFEEVKADLDYLLLLSE